MQTLYFPETFSENIDFPFQVIEMGCDFRQYTTFRPNGMEDYQFLYSLKGRGKLRLDGREYDIEPDSGFFFSIRDPHEYYAVDAPWMINYVIFNGDGVKDLLKRLDIPKHFVFHVHNRFYLDRMFHELNECVKARKPNWMLESTALLYALICSIKGLVTDERAPKPPSSSYLFTDVIRYMETHYMDTISLDDLAGILKVTPAYFCQIFKTTYRMRPMDFLNRLRIQKAKVILLADPYRPVKEVAEASGFHDPSYFCKVFKKLEGVSTKQFRQSSLDEFAQREEE